MGLEEQREIRDTQYLDVDLERVTGCDGGVFGEARSDELILAARETGPLRAHLQTGLKSIGAARLSAEQRSPRRRLAVGRQMGSMRR